MKTVSKKLLSLLLVAILLVSALPFQAFADPEIHDENIASHVSGVWVSDTTNHWKVCPNTNCEKYGTPLDVNPHTFSDGVCTVCGYKCDPHTPVADPATAVAATCVTPGKEADTICSACGKKVTEGAVIPATGVHTYDANNICTVCGATQLGAPAVMTLDANGGTINGAATATVNVNVGSPIGTLPDAFREGFAFAGWYAGNEQVTIGASYKPEYATLTAKWVENTYHLKVMRILNGDYSTAKEIYSRNVPAGTALLAYLNNNVSASVQAELAINPGYSWEYNFWKDYSGNQPLTSQADCMNQAQTVYVNFKANNYTLYFNANGGSVTPTSKTVTFKKAVGTLPTAYLSGKVFKGWKDVNGSFYDANTIYSIAGDTSLTAVWEDEALVLLYVYINGDFSGCNRMIAMDGFVKNGIISRSDVVSKVSGLYTPASGYLNIAGLFDEYTWSSYRSNTSKAGVENIQIDDSHVNKIYVMITNASTGSTVVNNSTSSGTTSSGTTSSGSSNIVGAYWVSDGNGTGHWVYPSAGSNPTNPTYIYIGTNPKTGDTAMLEIAATIMVLAAGALITIMTLRKKKTV